MASNGSKLSSLMLLVKYSMYKRQEIFAGFVTFIDKLSVRVAGSQHVIIRNKIIYCFTSIVLF